MRAVKRLWKRTLNFARANRGDRRLREEMEHHVALQTEENMRAGMSAPEARRQALLKFGPVEAFRESYHAEEGLPMIETILQDCRYAVRMLFRSPVLSIVAVLTLALGIGANTAIFSFLDAVMLRSLPVKDPQQLVKLGVEDWGGITDSFACTELYSYPFYRQFQRENQVFSETAAILSMMNDVHGFVDDRKESELIQVQTVSGTYFQTLGVGAQIGRVINENDDSTEGDHPVLVISSNFWKHRLGGDPAVLDHKVKLGDTIFNIIGVTPAEFFGTKVGAAPDMWTPLSMIGSIPPGWNGRKENFSESLYILGRLKPGITLEEATANANVLFPQILRSFSDAKLSQDNLDRLAHARVPLKSLARGLSDLRDAYSEPLKVLMVIVALVLLDRLRQHCELAAGPLGLTSARTSSSAGARCCEDTHYPSIAHRESAPRSCRRSTRHRIRAFRESYAAAHDFVGAGDDSSGCLAQPPPAGLYFRRYRLHGLIVRNAPGLTRDSAGAN